MNTDKSLSDLCQVFGDSSDKGGQCAEMTHSEGEESLVRLAVSSGGSIHHPAPSGTIRPYCYGPTVKWHMIERACDRIKSKAEDKGLGGS